MDINDINILKQDLIIEINKLAHKFELSSVIPDDYFEPGMMENLDQYYGSYGPYLLGKLTNRCSAVGVSPQPVGN